MDLSIIISRSIAVFLIISLIIYIKQRNKKKKEKIFSIIQSFAAENNCKISKYDHWSKSLIGLDNEANTLFFIRSTKEKEYRTIIALSEVRNCRMHKAERTVIFDKEKVKIIDRIELLLSFKDIQKADIALEFYNNKYDHLTLSEELVLAQKWLINITSNPNSKNNHAAATEGIKISPPIPKFARAV